MTRIKHLFAGILILAALVTGGAVQAVGAKLPSLYMGYVFTTHHTPLMVAAIKGEEFKSSGGYLKEDGAKTEISAHFSRRDSACGNQSHRIQKRL